MKSVERDLSKCASKEYYTSQKSECQNLKLEKCIPVKQLIKTIHLCTTKRLHIVRQNRLYLWCLM